MIYARNGSSFACHYLKRERVAIGDPPSKRDPANPVPCGYRVDSISKPQASSKGSGMYLEFLFRRAHSLSRVERKYWSGESLYSCTTCSNSVMVGTTGPIGSGLPQLGFPRRLAMKNIPSCTWDKDFFFFKPLPCLIPRSAQGIHRRRPQTLAPRPLWKLLIIIGFPM